MTPVRAFAILSGICFLIVGCAAHAERVPALTFSQEMRPARTSPFVDADQGSWFATVDPRGFQYLLDRNGDVAREMSAPFVGSRLKIALPGRPELELVVTRLTQVVSGVTTLGGHAAGDSAITFTLSIRGDRVLGRIRDVEGISWLLEPSPGEGHLLHKVNRRMIAPPHEPRLQSERHAHKSELSKTGGNGRVDMLFIYASDVTDPELRVSDLVDRFNTALSNSGVSSNNYIAVAGIVGVADAFQNQSRTTIMFNLRDRVSPFESIYTDYMFALNADIAFLLVEEDPGALDVPLFGRIGGAAFRLTASNPYAMSTSAYALGDNTAAHELGHLFGGAHEDENTNSINRPQISSDCSWMSMLGGYRTCDFVGLPASTDRIDYFSNPSLTYGGEPLGVSGIANMKEQLEAAMPVVSSWRTNGDPVAPGIPTTMSSSSSMCYGLNDVAWGAVAGADSYRVYGSESSAFTSFGLVYSGSDTSALIDVGLWPNPPVYLRARACNSMGCSNFSPQATATYFNGCP
jgi:hypothetical protein